MLPHSPAPRQQTRAEIPARRAGVGVHAEGPLQGAPLEPCLARGLAVLLRARTSEWGGGAARTGDKGGRRKRATGAQVGECVLAL